MTYLRVNWIHESEHLPVIMYFELGGDRYELRKIEVFSNGEIAFASEEKTGGAIELSDQPIPPENEIAEKPEFEVSIVTKEEFEEAWCRAISTL